jgi:hypothetical protein
MRIKKLSVILLAVLSLTACPKSTDPGLGGRVVRSIKAIPSVVRVVAPNASPKVFKVLDLGSQAFSEFVDNPTSSNWQHALNIWNNEIKPELLALNKTVLNGIIAGVDILLAQVVAPPDTSGDAQVVVAFKESDVKNLEAQIKAALKK